MDTEYPLWSHTDLEYIFVFQQPHICIIYSGLISFLIRHPEVACVILIICLGLSLEFLSLWHCKYFKTAFGGMSEMEIVADYLWLVVWLPVSNKKVCLCQLQRRVREPGI